MYRFGCVKLLSHDPTTCKLLDWTKITHPQILQHILSVYDTEPDNFPRIFELMKVCPIFCFVSSCGIIFILKFYNIRHFSHFSVTGYLLQDLQENGNLPSNIVEKLAPGLQVVFCAVFSLPIELVVIK